MELKQKKLALLLMVVMAASATEGACGAIPEHTWRKVKRVNKEGPYLGLVVPNTFEMSPLLQSSSFVHRANLPYLDVAGRRFRFGTIGKKKVIMVMTGLGMLNAGVSTQLLLDLFDVQGVVHFGIAGNANSDLQIGDVAIPLHWAHTGLWNWQRYGAGTTDELALESNGDYTRKIGYLNFSDYSDEKEEKFSGNFLNSVWYQPEELFSVNGAPEVRLWVIDLRNILILCDILACYEIYFLNSLSCASS